MAFILPNQARVLNAYAALIGQTPGNGAMADHVAYLNANGSAGYDAFIKGFFANVSNEALATSVLANLGLTNVFSLSNAVAALNSAGEGRITAILDFAEAVRTFAGPDAAMAAAAAKYNGVVDASYAYSQNSANVNGTTLKALNGNTAQFELTTGMDKLFGSDSTTVGDNFKAIIRDNANTLQSGDKIDGGAGNDTLEADIGNSQAFAITPDLTAVETVKIRVQAEQRDSGDNNIAGVGIIDAERSSGVTRWESNNSRADLIIEDVRTNSNNTTVAMVSTDPGHVDFGVYFAPANIGKDAEGTTGNNLTVNIANVLNIAKAGNPLGGFSGFNFTAAGKNVAVDLTGVTTYEQAVTATQAALTAAGVTDVTAALAPAKTVVFSTDVETYTTGQTAGTYNPIVLTSAASKLVEGQINQATGATNSNVVNTMVPTLPQAVATVTSVKVVLDDVGRGSTGGDLVIGSLSTGDTSTSKGIQKFDVTVERSSKLQNIESTNNTLEQVVVKNGAVNGNLTVKALASLQDVGINAALPGSTAHNDAYGLNDVRVFDASAMVGSVDLTAQLSDAVVAKYMDRKDVQVDKNADDAKFQYTLGAGNDKLVLDIGAGNLEAAGTTSRDDFQLAINGGAGNDAIELNVLDADNGAGFWYTNSKHNANMMIDGGAGNDTITTHGAGDVVINAGEGNDTVYADNTGAKGAWVINANNNLLGNLDGKDLAPAVVLYKASLTVTVSGATNGGATGVIDPAAVRNNVGFESTVTIETTNYLGGQAQINQAIKKAINSNDVLNKLLVAVDGPDNTVVINSLVDGAIANNDLAINITPVALTSLTASETTGINQAYKALVQNSTLNLTQANLQAYVDGLLPNNVPVLSDKAASGSGAQSDNTINLGTGNDVAVLGTGANSNDTIVFTGYNNGVDTIVNFSFDGAAQDKLNFGDYLKTKVQVAGSTSVESQQLVPVTFNTDKDAEANSVTVLKFASTATQKFADLTADKLLTTLNVNIATVNDISTVTFGGINGGTLDAQVIVNPVGGIRDHIVMVENDANLGEYKLFHLTSKTGDVAGTFNAANEIAIADFGATLGGAAFSANFANLGSIVKGAAALAGQDVGAVVPPTNPTNPGATTATATISAAGTTTDAGATVNTTYTINGGTYTHTIAGFNDGDVLKLFAGAATTVVPDADNTDGIQSIQFADAVAGTTTTITLTGLSAADDAALFNLGSISTVFGAGTIA